MNRILVLHSLLVS